MIRTKFFRTYLVDNDQPWWHNRLCFLWGRKPKPRQTEKGIDHGDFPHELRFEWQFSRRSSFRLGVQIGAEDGRDVTVSFGLPWLFSLYVSHTVGWWFINRVLPKSQTDVDGGGWPLDRELSVSSFEKALHVHLWTHPMDGGFGDYGRTKVGGWRDAIVSINPADLLGRRRCATEIVEPESAVLIPMPEGDYQGLHKVERRTWKRKLWPWWPLVSEQVTHDITVPDAVPYSGKGENGWDCGEDGIVSTGFLCRNVHEACALFAARALEMRMKRGDPRIWPETPGDRAARIATMRAERETVKSSGEASLDQPE